MAQVASSCTAVHQAYQKENGHSTSDQEDELGASATTQAPANRASLHSQPVSEAGLTCEQTEEFKLDAKRQICFDFTKGTCTRGEACKFSHDVGLIIEVNSQERGICFDYLRSACSRGALCRFSHDLSNFDPQDGQNSKSRNSPICYDFVKKQCTRGCECRYSHDLDSIMNSTRGRQPVARHISPAPYAWGIGPQPLYNPGMAMAALTGALHPVPGLPGVLTNPLAGAGAGVMPPEMMAAMYNPGHFIPPPPSPPLSTHPSSAAPADVAALQALASAAADPRNGHMVQAQILQQMQAMLSLMQQQQQLPSSGPRHGQVAPQFAGPMAGMNGYAETFPVQNPIMDAANGMHMYGVSSALHSPALAGVAQQMVAGAMPQQSGSQLNVNAASFIADPHPAGIGAQWSSRAHSAKSGAEGANAFQFARHQDSIPAASGQTQPQSRPLGSAQLSSAPMPATCAPAEDRQLSLGAESITGNADMPLRRRISQLSRHARVEAAATANEKQQADLPCSSAEMPMSAAERPPMHTHLMQRLPTSSEAPFGSFDLPTSLGSVSGSGNHGADPSRKQSAASPKLPRQLCGDLPSMRAASPQAFSTVNARPRPLSTTPSATLRDPQYSPEPSPQSPYIPTSLGFQSRGSKSHEQEVPHGLANHTSLRTSLDAGLSATYRRDDHAENVSPPSLPRHLSLDAASTRHMSFATHMSEEQYVGSRHRQSSLGPIALSDEAYDSEGTAANGLPSMGHATSLSDGLQHLNICQHIWRRI